MFTMYKIKTFYDREDFSSALATCFTLGMLAAEKGTGVGQYVMLSKVLLPLDVTAALAEHGWPNSE